MRMNSLEEMLPKRVSMLSGLRRGDILALDWKDYERDNKGKPTFRTVTKKYAAKMATESSRKLDGENHPSLSGICRTACAFSLSSRKSSSRASGVLGGCRADFPARCRHFGLIEQGKCHSMLL